MIAKLRRRLMLLVVGVMIAVTLGIVASIQAINLRIIDSNASKALDILGGSQGRRPMQQPAPSDAAPSAPDSQETSPESAPSIPQGSPQQRDRPEFEFPGSSPFASLSNSYTAMLDEHGQVTEWNSVRADLYTDAQIQSVADSALASGRESGRIGTQYYRLTPDDPSSGWRLIVLDARLEFVFADEMLRVAALVASAAGLLLSVGAYLLIRRMLQPVQDSFDRQKQFVWDASHEFKTPLAVISANAELLSREIGPNEYLGYIQSEVSRTDSLVQSLLTLARMDRGTAAVRLERLDLSEAVLSVALPFESTVFEAGRTLELEVPGGICCRGDRSMLQQLTVILLSNALKYSNEGGLIRLSLTQKGRGAVIRVYNTGAGIAPENLEKIFDRFYREDISHNREVAGNGLGLSIARTIAEAHRGAICAESEPGSSATFTVTIP